MKPSQTFRDQKPKKRPNPYFSTGKFRVQRPGTANFQKSVRLSSNKQERKNQIELPEFIANSTQYKPLVASKYKEKEELYENNLKQQAYINSLKREIVALKSELNRATQEISQKEGLIANFEAQDTKKDSELMVQVSKVAS